MKSKGTTEEPKTKEETPKESPKVLCPCCQHPTLSAPIEVKGALLDHYLACIMTGVPFSHTYPIYAGRLSVTVSQLTKEEGTVVNSACAVVAKCMEDISEDVGATAEEISGLIRVYSGIAEIKMTAAGGEKTLQPNMTVLDVCRSLDAVKKEVMTGKLTSAQLQELIEEKLQLLNNPDLMSALPAPMVVNLITAHSQLHNILMEAAFDSNFWEGIELA